MNLCVQCFDNPEHTVLLKRLEFVNKPNVRYLHKLLLLYYLAVLRLSTGVIA
jgi:hypothetical protein